MKYTKNILTKALLSFMSIFFILGCFAGPVEAAKNIQYVWTGTYDYSNKVVTSHLIETDKPKDISAVFKRNASDFKLGGYTDSSEIFSSDNVGSDSSGIYSDAWIGMAGVSANESDRSYASFVSTTLSNSFNMALAEVIRDGKIKFTIPEEFYALCRNLAECAVSGTSCTFKDYTINFRTATETDLKENNILETIGYGNYKGVTVDDYKVLVSKDGTETLLPVKFPKGYSSGQFLANMHSSLAEEKIVSHVSWKNFIVGAEKSLSKAIITSNSEQLYKSSSLMEAIVELFETLLNSLKSYLGIYTVESMMLNRDLRNTVYYKGIINRSWFSAANIVHWVCQIISVFAIVIGIVVTFLRRNISLMNPNARASLKESLINFFYAGLLLVAFHLFFYGLVQLNYLLVSILSKMVPAGSTLNHSLGGVSLTGIIIAFVLLFIEVKLNVTYLIRGVTIILLYATAPLFIVALIYGKKGKELFSTWVKELVGNIFMQSFHAVILTMYLLILSNATSTNIERIILAFSFLPLTQFFKEKFLSQGIADSTSAQASKGVGSLVSGGIGLAMMAGSAGIASFTGAGEGIRDIVKGKQEQISGVVGEDVFANSTVQGISQSSSGSKNAFSGVVSAQRSSPEAEATVTAGTKDNALKNPKIVAKAEKNSAITVGESENAKRSMNAQSVMTGQKQEYNSTFDGKRLAKKAFGTIGSAAMWGLSEAAQFGAQSIGADTGNIRAAQKISAGSFVGSYAGMVEEASDGIVEYNSRDYEKLEPETNYVSNEQLLSAGVEDLDVIEVKDDDGNEHYYLGAKMSEEYSENPEFKQYFDAFKVSNQANSETPNLYEHNGYIGFAEIQKDSLKKTDAGWQFDSVDTNAILNYSGFAKANNIRIDSKSQYQEKKAIKLQREQDRLQREQEREAKKQQEEKNKDLTAKKARRGHTNY